MCNDENFAAATASPTETVLNGMESLFRVLSIPRAHCHFPFFPYWVSPGGVGWGGWCTLLPRIIELHKPPGGSTDPMWMH